MKSKHIVISLFSIAALATLSIADASAASIRVRCEKGANYSKVDVDVRGVRPGRDYKARVKSGVNIKASSYIHADANGEAEFDFRSNINDIRAGATPIIPGFIVGNPRSVTGKIVDADGFVVAVDTATCKVK